MIGAGERRALRHGQLHVAGAGRHIDDEAVKFAPRDFAQQLGDRRHHHRAAPHDGGLLFDHQADGNDLHAMRDQRHEKALLDLRFFRQPEQARRRGSEYVRIEQADPPAFLRHGDGQIGGDRRFADPALARGDRDDMAHAGDAFGNARTRRRLGGRVDARGWAAGAPGARSEVSVTIAALTPVDRAKRLFGGPAHGFGFGGAGGIDDDGQINLAVALGEAADRARSRQRRLPVRSVNRAERLRDGVFINQNSISLAHAASGLYKKNRSFGSAGN